METTYDTAFEQGKSDAKEIARMETEGSDGEGIREWIDGERQAIAELANSGQGGDDDWVRGYLAGLGEFEQRRRVTS